MVRGEKKRKKREDPRKMNFVKEIQSKFWISEKERKNSAVSKNERRHLISSLKGKSVPMIENAVR